MQLTRVFTSLADTYGHILRTDLAEVDLKDVVLNRRVLVVLLPALEKSPDELSNLGKVVIASMRSMMAAGLGDAVEGDYRDLITRKPTNAETPFLCILDEYGYYAVKGFAVVPAQARSLGFSVVFAGQDLPAFQKASKEEAASIGANTNIKICMKLEDPTDTWEFFMKGAGEAYVTTVDSFNANQSSLSNSYLDTKSAKTDKRSRIDLLDLKDQGLGEAHIFFRSDIIRAKTFYANPEPCQKMRLNQMVKVGLLPDRDLYDLVKGIEDFERINLPEQVKVEADDILDEVFNRINASNETNLIVKALGVLVNDEEADVTVEEVGRTEVDVFSRFKGVISGAVIDPLLNRKNTVAALEMLLRFSGVTKSGSVSVTQEFVDKVSILTSFSEPESSYDIKTVYESMANVLNSKTEDKE